MSDTDKFDLGSLASEADALTYVQDRRWDVDGTGSSNPVTGTYFYDSGAKVRKWWNGSAWQNIVSSTTGQMFVRKYSAIAEDWIDDAAAGSVGGEWDFLVDGDTTPSGWVFSTNPGVTVHTAKIQSSGYPYFDYETTAVGQGGVILHRDIVGLYPPVFWPATYVSMDSILNLVTGGHANGQIMLSLYDWNDPAAGGKDLMRCFWRGPGFDDFLYARILDDISAYSPISGNTDNILGVRTKMVMNVTRAVASVKHTYATTEKMYPDVSLNDYGRYWYREDFSETDPLRIKVELWNGNDVGRMTAEIYDIQAMLYEAA